MPGVATGLGHARTRAMMPCDLGPLSLCTDVQELFAMWVLLVLCPRCEDQGFTTIKLCLAFMADGHVRFGMGKVKQGLPIVSFTGSLHVTLS